MTNSKEKTASELRIEQLHYEQLKLENAIDKVKSELRELIDERNQEVYNLCSEYSYLVGSCLVSKSKYEPKVLYVKELKNVQYSCFNNENRLRICCMAIFPNTQTSIYYKTSLFDKVTQISSRGNILTKKEDIDFKFTTTEGTKKEISKLFADEYEICSAEKAKEVIGGWALEMVTSKDVIFNPITFE